MAQQVVLWWEPRGKGRQTGGPLLVWRSFPSHRVPSLPSRAFPPTACLPYSVQIPPYSVPQLLPSEKETHTLPVCNRPSRLSLEKIESSRSIRLQCFLSPPFAYFVFKIAQKLYRANQTVNSFRPSLQSLNMSGLGQLGRKRGAGKQAVLTLPWGRSRVWRRKW